MADLEALRQAAMEAGAFAPALRAIELQGRCVGLWKGEAPMRDDLTLLLQTYVAKGGEKG